MSCERKEIERLLEAVCDVPYWKSDDTRRDALLSAIDRVLSERDAAVAHVARITNNPDWWLEPWVPVRLDDLKKMKDATNSFLAQEDKS